MANRRMISLEVVDTDAFLDMPQSSQLLYFHLNSRADDDGFVANPRRIMRDTGAQVDDVKLLIAKKFLISFEDGVVVVKHWRINNYIRKDIYKETKYLNHKQTLFIRPNGAYTLTDDGQAIRVPNGHFQLEDIKLKNRLSKPQKNVHVASTERALSIGKVSIGKDRLDKDSIAETSSAPFSLEEKLKDMEKIENSYLDIIATFIREKPVLIENSRQLSAVISRYCRVAKKLAGAYTNDQIFKVARIIQDGNRNMERKGEMPIDYTLETIYKKLTK